MTEKHCSVCKREVPVASVLPVCVECLRADKPEAENIIHQAHQWRSKIGLPVFPPQSTTGVKCTVCANDCTIPEGEQGYCGLRSNNGGKLESWVSATQALMHYYLDAHVTNCCASYFCPAGIGVGYPQVAYRQGPELGYANLAVFLYGCGFSCLFCQNISHKQVERGRLIDTDHVVNVIQENRQISCVCYFGGSPEPQLPFIIRLMEKCKDSFNGRILRQCLEMNGNAKPSLMRKAGLLVVESGGIVKFDLKAYSPSLNRALCGVSNEVTLKNFTMLAETLAFENRSYPPLMATTLLVPYYVDEFEVSQIAKFIKELNQPSIEYSLLVFHPQHLMRDLPITPLAQAQRCYDAAREHLEKVHIGNLDLLGGKLRL